MLAYNIHNIFVDEICILVQEWSYSNSEEYEVF